MTRTPQTSSNRRRRPAPSIQAYIPKYLSNVVFPYHGDFCQTPFFHPKLIVQLMAEGFLPIATTGALLPKLHQERCVIHLPGSLHISKSTKKKTKRFGMTLNKRFKDVIQGCHAQHPHCWLIPPLVEAFQAIFESKGMVAGLEGGGQATVRFVSVEIWNSESGELVAGELGYTVGSIYTSLTGFSRQDSSGSVQLVTLGALLAQNGFSIWDLGMDMDYKRDLGATLMPRAAYVREVHRVRTTDCELPHMDDAINCKTIVTSSLSQPTPLVASHPSDCSDCPKKKAKKDKRIENQKQKS